MSALLINWSKEKIQKRWEAARNGLVYSRIVTELAGRDAPTPKRCEMLLYSMLVPIIHNAIATFLVLVLLHTLCKNTVNIPSVQNRNV